MKTKIEPKVILLDFDGTCVMHDFPAIGDEVEGAVTILRRLVDNGHKLVLHTCRSGIHLDDAAEWFKNREIPLFGINENPELETGSRKVYGHLHIDDHNLGTPLTFNPVVHKKPFVDWFRVKNLLLINGYL